MAWGPQAVTQAHLGLIFLRERQASAAPLGALLDGKCGRRAALAMRTVTLGQDVHGHSRAGSQGPGLPATHTGLQERAGPLQAGRKGSAEQVRAVHRGGGDAS